MHPQLILYQDLAIVMPFLFFSLSILSMMLYGVCISTSFHYGKPILIQPLSWLSVAILGWTSLMIWQTPVETASLLGQTLLFDPFVGGVQLLLLLFTAGCIVISFDYFKWERITSFEYVILQLLSLLGMLLLVASADLLSLYIAVEMQSLAFYVLAAYRKDSPYSVESGLKYFVMGAFASGLLLYGSSLVYGYTGSTHFEDIMKALAGSLTETSTPTLAQVGMLFLFAGLLFKMAVVPFHMWAPDVYEGAPATVSAFFSVTPKIGILAVVIKLVFYSFYELLDSWSFIFFLCTFASMAVGAVGGIQQLKLKRLLAYSSIGHVGYILLGLCAGTLAGAQSMLFYVVVYMVMNLCLWTALLGAYDPRSGRRMLYVTDFARLHESQPLLAFTLLVALFSMAGIPPLAGFFAKVYVFLSAIDASLYFLALAGVLFSAIGTFYYLRLIKILYFEPVGRWLFWTPPSREKSLLLTLTTGFLLLFVFFPDSLLHGTHLMVVSLL